MSARRILTATAVLATLAGCAGAPAPAPTPAPSPALGVEGAYVFSGHVPGTGSVDGTIEFDAEGAATVTSRGVTCASAPRASAGRLWLSCGRVTIGVMRDDDALASRAVLAASVSEIVDRPADPFECHGGDTGAGMGRANCVRYGVKRAARTRRSQVAARVWRVE